MGDGSGATTARARRQVGRRLGVPIAVAAAVLLLASGCVVNGTWTASVISGAELYDVSCTSPDDCLAVGTEGGTTEVVRWDGSTWEQLPTPGGAYGWSVDCGSPERCASSIRLASVDEATFAVWNGSEWEPVPLGITTPDAPDSYSCAPDGSCIFVLTDAEQTVVWDGDTFASHPFVAGTDGDPASRAVDCASASSCTSIGAEGQVATWDGSSWTTTDTVDLLASALSCPGPDRCVAVGHDVDGGALATWDGVTWTVEPLPGGNAAAVVDVSCSSSVECVAVADPPQGFSGDGDPVELAWNGVDWYVAPKAPGGPTASYLGVSCVPLWCFAVGYVPPSGGGPFEFVSASYEWTNP